ncbi:MAG TPA: hypothetical protein PKC39_11475 [Ferruginibacter sp.]|nr:hypothetical protein [Ferruginibacter sp.]HMP21569.1 hypothetical protein [Ferruginibacter sp.]
MSSELKNILSNSNKDISNQQLVQYLCNQLPPDDTHEVEKTMADDAFVDDAVEGLQQMGSVENIEAYTDQLNHFLQKQTAKNKQRKTKRRYKDSPYTYAAIILILLLAIVGYFVLKNVGR